MNNLVVDGVNVNYVCWLRGGRKIEYTIRYQSIVECNELKSDQYVECSP